MKRAKRRLPVPQHEFGFTTEVFRLFSETGLDGELLARERDESNRARAAADTAQRRLFSAQTRDKV